MYYNKEKEPTKRYLTDAEIAAYMQAIKIRCFCLGDISEKVFLDKSLVPNYRREKLQRVFDKEVMITRRELERLDFYCSCVIITQEEYREYQMIKEWMKKPKEEEWIKNNPNPDKKI